MGSTWKEHLSVEERGSASSGKSSPHVHGGGGARLLLLLLSGPEHGVDFRKSIQRPVHKAKHSSSVTISYAA